MGHSLENYSDKLNGIFWTQTTYDKTDTSMNKYRYYMSNYV